MGPGTFMDRLMGRLYGVIWRLRRLFTCESKDQKIVALHAELDDQASKVQWYERRNTQLQAQADANCAAIKLLREQLEAERNWAVQEHARLTKAERKIERYSRRIQALYTEKRAFEDAALTLAEERDDLTCRLEEANGKL